MSKKRKKPVETIESYHFEIVHIDPTYSLRVGHSPLDRGAYAEHLHVLISAKCLWPEKLAGREINFTLIGSRELIAETQSKLKDDRIPLCVGTLKVKGERSEYLGVLPYDTASSVSQLVLAGGIRFITLAGPRLMRGSSPIQSLSFSRDYDPDEL